MARPTLMGASVSLAEDQTPVGTSSMEVLRPGPSGELVPDTIPQPPRTVFAVVHFVELDDGRRVTLGGMSLHTSLGGGEAQLREDVREFVFEDDLREVEEQPRWEAMIELLALHGVHVNEAGLARLPFEIELDEDVRALT